MRPIRAHARALVTFLHLAFGLLLLNRTVRADFLATAGQKLAGSGQNVVASSCQQGLDFVSLKEFRAFIEQYKSRTLEQLQQDRLPSGCVKHRQAILELGALVHARQVCDASKIDALVDYHERHFAKRGLFASPLPKPIMHKFFSKYAIQVAYVCKKNLIRNLELSRDELQARSKVFEEARERIFRDEPSIKANIELLEEQPDEPASTNVKPKDGVEMTLNEYRDALTKLKRPEDILTFDRRQCERLSTRKLSIARSKVQTFFKPALMCLQLARYYGGSILSIARLANIGYIATHEELDVRLSDSPLVKNWIIAAQVCEPTLYMRSEKLDPEWATIDTCSERVVSIETMVFNDNIDELDSGLLDEMLPKSEATRNNAQKIMKSAMKKMAKVNLMKELKSGKIKKRSIFSHSLNMLGSASAAGSMSKIQMDMVSNSGLSSQLLNGAVDVSSLKELSTGQTPDEHSFGVLLKALADSSASKILNKNSNSNSNDDDNDSEGAVSYDPMTSLASTLTILAVMLTFEWLFFVVMTLAARICHQLNFNFDNILTFPPKVLSWSDADFTRFNDGLEKVDEDDFFDFDELNPDEQKQRLLLKKVFGKPPPMLFRE